MGDGLQWQDAAEATKLLMAQNYLIAEQLKDLIAFAPLSPANSLPHFLTARAGTPFGSLPILDDDVTVLSGSTAIARYLAEKYRELLYYFRFTSYDYSLVY